MAFNTTATCHGRKRSAGMGGAFGSLCTGAALALLVGCASSPEPQYDRISVDVPPRFDAVANTNAYEPQGWLSDFGDADLRELVSTVLAHNYDLQAAAARLDAAAADRRTVEAARYPQLNGSAAGTRRRTTAELSSREVANETHTLYNLGLNLVWEVDLWGKLKNRTQAAIGDYEAEAALYRAAALSMAAAALKSWFSLVEVELQVQLAEETLQVFEHTLTVVQGSYKRGLPNRALDVRLTRANVEAARSAVVARQRQRDAASRGLEVLMGRYPADALQVTTNLPALRREVPAGLPSALLRRRPDVVAAERRLAASLERVRAAKKEMLPTIGLTTSGGATSGQLRDLLDTERIFWTVAGNLAQPIYQGGRLRAGVDLADAGSRQALASFSQAVLNAFQEVETFLAAESLLRVEEGALARAARESMAAEQLAWQQYQRGLVDIITVLEAQRRAFTARSTLLSVTNSRLLNRVNLYLALGGDFPNPEKSVRNSDPATAPVAAAGIAGGGGRLDPGRLRPPHSGLPQMDSAW